VKALPLDHANGFVIVGVGKKVQAVDPLGGAPRQNLIRLRIGEAIQVDAGDPPLEKGRIPFEISAQVVQGSLRQISKTPTLVAIESVRW
jgi:hypothetical protein